MADITTTDVSTTGARVAVAGGGQTGSGWLRSLVSSVIFLTVLVGAVVWQVRVTGGATAVFGATPAFGAVPSADPAAVFAPVDWRAVNYPAMDCGVVGVRVLAVRLAQLTGDGRPEAVVHVRCDSGAGSPPSGLFVFTGPVGQAAKPKPRLLATLLDPAADELADQVGVDAAGVTASGYRYTSPDVPKCCPDATFSYRWHWTGRGFARA